MYLWPLRSKSTFCQLIVFNSPSQTLPYPPPSLVAAFIIMLSRREACPSGLEKKNSIFGSSMSVVVMVKV